MSSSFGGLARVGPPTTVAAEALLTAWKKLSMKSSGIDPNSGVEFWPS